MSTYKKVTFLVLFLSFFFLKNLEAQVSINEIKGTRLSVNAGYEGIEGSPYFNKEWSKGQLYLSNGKQVTADKLQYDFYADQILYKDESNNVLNITNEVQSFEIKGAVFQNNFPINGKLNSKSYYQVLAKGNLNLLKKQEVTIVERTAFGVPNIKSFKIQPKYYILKNSEWTSLKTDSKAVAEILEINKTELDTYLKSNNLDLKKDIDLKEVFDHFQIK